MRSSSGETVDLLSAINIRSSILGEMKAAWSKVYEEADARMMDEILWGPEVARLRTEERACLAATSETIARETQMVVCEPMATVAGVSAALANFLTRYEAGGLISPGSTAATYDAKTNRIEVETETREVGDG